MNSPQAEPVPAAVRDFRHLIRAALSPREARPHRRARRIRAAQRALAMMDGYHAGVARTGGVPR